MTETNIILIILTAIVIVETVVIVYFTRLLVTVTSSILHKNGVVTKVSKVQKKIAKDFEKKQVNLIEEMKKPMSPKETIPDKSFESMTNEDFAKDYSQLFKAP